MANSGSEDAMIADPVEHETQLEDREDEQAQRDAELEEPEAPERAERHPEPECPEGRSRQEVARLE